MFTGIVSAVGRVVEVSSGHLAIEHAAIARRIRAGASVAVNGCCLTVVQRAGARFSMDVVPETLRRTNLGSLTVGSPVNLERPLAADGLLDGHLVQGHVDATAAVIRVNRAKSGREVTIDLPTGLRSFVVEKGSIAVDGVSLTVAGMDERHAAFTVAFIPHTLEATIARHYIQGSTVNVEADIVARYVARILRR
jgi:riboflavin synthase